MKLRAYKEGVDAGLHDWFKGTRHENPYSEGTEDHASWNRGYSDGQGIDKAWSKPGEEFKE